MALSRALVLLTLGLSAACSEDSEQPVFLGAAGSATFEAPPTFIPGAAGAAGAAGSGGASAGAAGSPRCGLALTVPSADQVATLERDGASYALTVGASVTHLTGTCPDKTSATSTPGVGDVRALAVVGGVTFVSGATGTRGGEATCPGAGFVALAAEGTHAVGLSLDGKSLSKLTHSLITKTDGQGNEIKEALCEREDVPLAKGIVALSLGASSVPGTVWASIVPATGAIFAQRIATSSGALLADVKLSALCTADAFVDLGARIAVLDATCPRVAVFDAKGARLIDRPLSGAPRGMAAAVDDTAAVLVALSLPAPPAAKVEFQLLSVAP